MTPGRPRTETRTSRTYDTVIDLTDVGADPTGEERIDPILRDNYGSDTKLLLPEGRYRLGQQVFTEVDRLALVGEDATLVPATADTDILLSFDDVSNLYVDGLSIDQTGGRGCGCLYIRCTGGDNLVRDVAFEGFIDKKERVNGCLLFSEGTDTRVVLDGVDMRDGARNGLGVFVFPQRLYPDPDREPGSVIFSNLFLRGWGREGLYASPHGGPLSVLGGRYENNAIDQVRIGGGGPDSEAIVRDVTVRVVDPPAHVARGGHGNLRGIWLEEGDEATVENCEVTIGTLNGGVSQGAIVISNQYGRATIRGTSIRTDVPVPALRIQPPTTEYDPKAMPSLDRLPEKWTVTCEDLSLTGDAESGLAVHLRDRAGCRFEDLSLDQRGGTRHGLLADSALETEITGGQWTTSGYPTIVGGEAESSDDDVLVCFRRVGEMRSTRFTGRPLQTKTPEGRGRISCLPSPIVEERSNNPYEPYVGVTGMDAMRPEGRRIIANYNGAEFSTQ